MTTNELTVSLPKLFPAQKEKLQNAKRNNLMILPRRWGKTTFCKRLVNGNSIKNKNYRAAWACPTWQLMLDTFEEYRNDLHEVTTRVNREDRRIELINGSVIEFWSSDNPQSARGRKYNLFVIDEIQRQKNIAAFIRGSVRPTLMDRRGDLWILGTANGEGSELHEFYLDCVNDPINWQVATGKLEENPLIHPDEIAMARKDLGPNLAAQELDGLFVKVDGVTPLVRSNQWELLYGIKDNTARPRVLAVDASISGDLTGIVGVWSEDDIIYIDYEDIILIEPDETTGEVNYQALENILWNKWLTGKYSTIAYDPYQLVSTAQRLRAKGVRLTEFTQNSMRSKGDSHLRQLINDSKIRHPNHYALTEHVLNAKLKFAQDSIRLVKTSKKYKIDLAVALSMAAWTLHSIKPSMLQHYKPLTNKEFLNVLISSPVSDIIKADPFADIRAMSPWNT